MNRPSEPSGAQAGERKALSRELSEFLIELSISLHKHAMYPEGHPSLGPAAIGVVNRFDRLMVERSSLSIGVARHQLVIEGVATDSRNPVLSDLAGRLHRHHLGAITFQQGMDPEELQQVLRVLAVEADRSDSPLGLGPPEELRAWSHIRLYPITYERLQMLSDDQSPAEDDEGRRHSRPAHLWLGLARAAMAAESLSEEDSPDPAVVADAIRQNQSGTAYDQVIVGYMLQIAEELKTSKGRETLDLKKRISRMVKSLDDGTRERLVTMGGDRDQRRKFLLSASEGMAAGAVLELVRAAGKDEQNVSDSMLRMLRKLAHHAESGRGERRVRADTTVREQVAELIRGWTLADPNPDEYRKALDRMASAGPVFSVASERVFAPENRRIVEMALEVDQTGDSVNRAVEALIDEGEIMWVVERLERAGDGGAAEGLWRVLSSVERFDELVRREPIDVRVIDRLLPKLGMNAVAPMLDALSETDHRLNRRILLDRLVAMGPAVGPLVVERLEDERWFVLRNMLSILTEVPELPQGFKPSHFLSHEDSRVRREAYKILFKHEETRARSICRALADSDDRAVMMALTAALESCPAEAVPLVVSRASPASDPEQRLLAIRVLGGARHTSALEALLKFTAPRRALLGQRLPSKTPEVLAALRALRGYRGDARAAAILTLAAESRDPELAQAAEGGGS